MLSDPDICMKKWCVTVHMQLKKTKPEPRICPVCGDKVGISLQSLAVHIRTKHHEAYADFEGMLHLPESPK